MLLLSCVDVRCCCVLMLLCVDIENELFTMCVGRGSYLWWVIILSFKLIEDRRVQGPVYMTPFISHIHTCIRTFTHTSTPPYIHTSTHKSTNPHIHTSVHPHIHPYIHTSTQTATHISIHPHIYPYIHTSIIDIPLTFYLIRSLLRIL